MALSAIRGAANRTLTFRDIELPKLEDGGLAYYTIGKLPDNGYHLIRVYNSSFSVELEILGKKILIIRGVSCSGSNIRLGFGISGDIIYLAKEGTGEEEKVVANLDVEFLAAGFSIPTSTLSGAPSETSFYSFTSDGNIYTGAKLEANGVSISGDFVVGELSTKKLSIETKSILLDKWKFEKNSSGQLYVSLQ